jgi:hypothetical protein
MNEVKDIDNVVLSHLKVTNNMFNKGYYYHEYVGYNKHKELIDRWELRFYGKSKKTSFTLLMGGDYYLLEDEEEKYIYYNKFLKKIKCSQQEFDDFLQYKYFKRFTILESWRE